MPFRSEILFSAHSTEAAYGLEGVFRALESLDQHADPYLRRWFELRAPIWLARAPGRSPLPVMCMQLSDA